MSMELKGSTELRGDIARMADALRTDERGGATVNRILEAAAQPVLEQMIQNASTDPHPRSGKLRSALRIKKGSRRRGARVTIGAHTESGAAYGVPVEFGHGGPHPAPPHPFVRPAFDARAEESYELLKQRLRTALDQRG
ncbi:MAG: HK97 gp10 family phage protein [Spirochaetales bacterium]|nr:HK97 gp10 family phage protein [Spirochaetales bacterium]